MQYNRYTIKTITDAEDIISATLAELGIEGIEIEDKIPLTEEELAGMGVSYCATCDGAGKSKEESARRISRVVCADLDILSMDEITEMSKFIHQKQVEQIASGLKEVSEREDLDKVIVTGLGKDILCAEAAKLLNLEVQSMGDYYTDEECVVAPAIGTALMMKNFIS